MLRRLGLVPAEGTRMTARYERVDRPRDRCVAVTFWRHAGAPFGSITGPNVSILGSEYRVPSPLRRPSPASQAFTTAEEFARDLAMPLVVIDPEGIWNASWGDLYRAEQIG
jgi:hypothetical protein